MSKNLFKAITPKGYYIAVIAAIILRLTDPDSAVLSNVILNIVLLLLSFKFAIFIHECGHLLLAKSLGGTPRRLVLGKGHIIWRRSFGNLKIIIHANINSGLAYSAFTNMKFIRFKLFAESCGGFLLNFGIAAILIAVVGINTDFIAGQEGVSVLKTLIIANAAVGLSSLIPYYVNTGAIKVPSDGLRLLLIPFKWKDADLMNLAYVSDQLDAYDLLESKSYRKALSRYKKLLIANPDFLGAYLNIGISYLKLGKFEKGLENLETFQQRTENLENNSLEPYLWNGLGWTHLLLNNLELASKYSALAMQSTAEEPEIYGTRGCVLVETGKLKMGKNLLKGNMDFQIANSATLMAALYLAYAYKLESKYQKSKKHLTFVQNNLKKLDVDERHLYDRINSRINEVQ